MSRKNSFGNSVVGEPFVLLFVCIGLVITVILFFKRNFTFLKASTCRNVKDPYGNYIKDDKGGCTVKIDCKRGYAVDTTTQLCVRKPVSKAGINCTKTPGDKSTNYVTDEQGNCTVFNGCNIGFTGGSTAQKCSPISQETVAPGSGIRCDEDGGCLCLPGSKRDGVNKGQYYSMCNVAS